MKNIIEMAKAAGAKMRSCYMLWGTRRIFLAGLFCGLCRAVCDEVVIKDENFGSFGVVVEWRTYREFDSNGKIRNGNAI